MTDIGKGTVGIGFDQAAITGALAGLSARLLPGLRGIGMRGGRALSAGMVLAAGAVAVGLGASVRAAANFDAAMTESLAIMGDVSDAMRNDMADAAREVGRTTTFSATEAAEAFFFLASAGLDAEASINALPQVAAFAQAGMFDLSRATDLLTDAQSALGLASDDATENLDNMARVSDVLVGANTLANASVEQFSSALTNKAGAALKTFNIDVEEGVAVLAALADQGVKGTEAGQGLAIILRDLSRAAVNNTEVFEEFGIQVFDSEGNIRNLGDVVGDLEGALGGMSDAQITATLESLGLTRQVGDMLKLLLGSSDDIAVYEDALREAGGVTQEVADKQLESLQSKLSLLKGRLTDIGIEVGTALIPALTTAAEWVGDVLVPAFAHAIGVIQDTWIPVIREAADFIRDVFGPAIELLVDLFGSELEPAVADARDGVGEFTTESRELREEIEKWGNLMLTGLGIAGALASIKLLSLAFGGLKTLLGVTLVPLIKGVVIPAIGALAGILGISFGSAALLVVGVGLLVGAFWWFSDEIGAALTVVNEKFFEWRNRILQWFAELPGMIMNNIRELPGNLIWLFTTMMSGAWTVVSTIGETILGWFQGLPGWVQVSIAGLPGIVIGLFATTMGGTLTTVVNVGAEVIGWFRELPGRVGGLLAGLPGLLGGIASDAISRMRSVVVSLGQGIVNWFRELPGRIGSMLAGLPGELFSIGASAVQGLIDGLGSIDPWSVARSLGDRVVDGIKSAIPFMSPSPATIEIGEAAATGLIKGMELHEADLRDTAERLGERVVSGVAPRFAPAMPSSDVDSSRGVVLRVNSGAESDIAHLIRRLVRAEGGGDVQIAFGR